MKTLAFIFVLLTCHISSFGQSFQNNQTPDYEQLIAEYQDLARQSTKARLLEMGPSDFGKNIQLFVYSEEEIFDPELIKKAGKGVLLINNGIHAGESCGIDASLELAKRLCAENSIQNSSIKDLVILIIPAYNIGGMHNRNPYSRANQNGPEEYGFRGNAKNLDLNRDFIKCDSKNAASFSKAFQLWDPDFFIDTHTTNGSDHQYTLTLISSQADKMNPTLKPFLQDSVLPHLYQSMEKRKMPITPYVYPLKASPDHGIKDFLEGPRFSSGYASLFSCFSFITEAHVYKNYSDRVWHTLAFLEEVIKFQSSHNELILELRKKARASEQNQAIFNLNWALDSSKYVEIDFKGYDYKSEISPITGQAAGLYDQTAPYHKKIRHYNRYQSTASVTKPAYYLIPQAYEEVYNRLKWNNIEIQQLKKDSLIVVECYYIEDFDSPSMPYEGHYLHQNIRMRSENQKIQFYKGDYLISSKQKNVRYLIECLEPESSDSFFAWNFFDASMQQKEWFSAYAFEDKAKAILSADPNLKAAFEQKKKADSGFSKDHFAQLYYIYKRSPYFEKSAFRYPVYRLN